MKIVKTYIYSHLAHLDLAKLADEEIDAFIKDDNYISINPIHAQAAGGIKLLVNNEDYTKALDALNRNDFQYLKNEFPEVEIGEQRKCKNCGSINILQRNSWLIGLIFLLFLFLPLTIKTKKYVCLDCSYKWKEK